MFIHYRTGERDGVSLEIEKRAQLFRQLGQKVSFLSGFDPRYKKQKDIYIVPEIDIKRRLPSFLRETFFDERILDRTLSWLLYQTEEEKIYNQVVSVLRKVQPDIIFIHNIFSLAYHLPATTAILKAIDFHPTKIVAVHHDFWWERGFFKTPRYPFLKTIIDHLPPHRDYIQKHQVINSHSQKDLEAHRGLPSQKIGDYFDFDFPLPPHDDYNKDFLKRFGILENDLVILHATRIVERKAIENAIYFAYYLQKKIKKSKDFTFKGKRINKQSRVVLLLPNFVDLDSDAYFKELQLLAEKLNIQFLWIADHISLDRVKVNGMKRYSFWDCYTFSDFITYTSYQEGFGNQLLEAFWAKRIPLVFEYPVFREDIKNEGYHVISLGNQMRKYNGFNLVGKEKFQKASGEALSLLQNEEVYRIWANENFATAKQLHGLAELKKDLQSML